MRSLPSLGPGLLTRAVADDLELPEPGSRHIAGMDPEPGLTATSLFDPLQRGVSGRDWAPLSATTQGHLFPACAANTG